MESISELCCHYIVFLRALSLVHQNNHWLTKGRTFTSDHQLFDKLYNQAAKDADLAAERFIGLFGSEVLNLNAQASLLKLIMEDFANGEPLTVSLKAEKRFIEQSDRFYKTLEKEGKLSLGLTDMLPEIASHREEACYHLQQTLGAKHMDAKIAARKSLLKRLQKSAQVLDMNEEQSALAAVKAEISSTLMRLTKGKGANFHLQAQRSAPRNGTSEKYNFTVVLSAGGPEAMAKDQLQAVLPVLIGQVPFFHGKIGSAVVSVT